MQVCLFQNALPAGRPQLRQDKQDAGFGESFTLLDAYPVFSLR